MKAGNVLEIGTDGCQDSVLLNDWHAVAASTEIAPGALVAMTLLERSLPGETIRGRSMSGMTIAFTAARGYRRGLFRTTGWSAPIMAGTMTLPLNAC